MDLLRRLVSGRSARKDSEERPAVRHLGDRRGEVPPDAFLLDASGGGFEVVGESHYRAAIALVVGEAGRAPIKLVTWATLVHEPHNPYDRNAVSVHIEGRKVGHLARPDAAAFAPLLDRITAAGRTAMGRADIYGGWEQGTGERADFGITVYVGPPAAQERLIARELDGKTRADLAAQTPAMRPGRRKGPGMVRGRPHEDWWPEVTRLRDLGDEPGLEALLLEICDATEAEAQAEGFGVAPAAYERLAILYRRRKDRHAEIAILERFAAQPHAPGALPPKLLARLDKVRGET